MTLEVGTVSLLTSDSLVATESGSYAAAEIPATIYHWTGPRRRSSPDFLESEIGLVASPQHVHPRASWLADGVPWLVLVSTRTQVNLEILPGPGTISEPMVGGKPSCEHGI
ncbi:hypothetical protein BO94DRAFT_541898 [Aspergillus sclerotioniger CBS 115572]|uniref:Uncharacterized protein n=1 Tax=Aspergillus sclerotioniger CBS 115572 TaxID=1450535 RepID=A0A317XCF5_9EURO|nr:hypothetical protein BO94DRAFT_541898 [Aspergillus sclerotioniger CBS 115572]PWY95801.1 hypothetical protein BO94DRAFT_541898 [Aspergillus sclerotioniger CBS 115572]